MMKKELIKKILIGAGIGFIVGLLNYGFRIIVHYTSLSFHPYTWFIKNILNCHGDPCYSLEAYAILLSFPLFMLIGVFVAILRWYKK